ncbi:class I SAM-dependent methyltransferase [Nonomuraea sp. MCN248]|uniref:Class I SAM-dependent methyltransferase n=1 Tax=Nonomuraea corallina TaxID=2989783 RepID=A0ABT4S4L0_9ACTN|nr:class I SAM-dependent methyltransferase [Nonomuraea corallina]MDA0632139.1 class I SAM-dependent methyltransferase [Nonomuraea corallina]
MRTITDRVDYWNHYASGVSQDHPEDALKSAFGWTQYSGHGPGEELLGDPATALELGSCRGHAVAALATKGIVATGVDLSPVQVERALSAWGHLPDAHFVQADVLDYLADLPGAQWDAIYSIFGAVWFTDPERLLPLVFERLAQGGKLVFSQASAVPGSYGVQGMYGNGFTGRAVWIYRWAYEPETWRELLLGVGFRDVRARIHPAPAQNHVGTLIVEAWR